MKNRKVSPLLLLVVLGLWCTAPSRAAIVINAVESGGDVVATLSGSISSLAGATPNQTGAGVFNYNFARATDATFAISDQPSGTTSPYNNYDIPTYPANFGSGGNAIAASSTASTSFNIRSSPAAQIWIAQDYVLGTAVTGDLTWTSSTFTSLGWTEGSYVWSWAGDSVTLNIGGAGPGPGPAAVPEPGQVAASLLLLSGIGGFVWMKRRRTAKAATTPAAA